MAAQAILPRIIFLEGTWKAVLYDQTEPFSKSLLADYVSSDVIDSLPEYTTLKGVLLACHTLEAFEESYIKSFVGLMKSWNRLAPESRQGIMQYLQECDLQANGNLRRHLQPHKDDAVALTIRWDIADRLYTIIHEKASKACQGIGLELLQPRGVPQQKGDFRTLVQRGQAMLLALLRERIIIDKVAVLVAVGHDTPVVKNKLMNNLNRAYIENLDAFRAGLMHWALNNLHAFSAVQLFKDVQLAKALTPIQESILREHMEALISPFMQEFERMSAGMDETSPDPATYDKIRRFFDSSATLH